jgi:hypothetical protein
MHKATASATGLAARPLLVTERSMHVPRPLKLGAAARWALARPLPAAYLQETRLLY